MPKTLDKASELEDVEVDRMDGVDDPATGRRFLFMKSADAEEDRAHTLAFAKASFKALRMLAKSEAGFPADTVAALTELAELSDAKDLKFKTAAPEEKKKEESTTQAASGQGNAAPGDVGGAVAAAMRSALAESFGGLTKSFDAFSAKLDEVVKAVQSAKKEGDHMMDEEDEEEEDKDLPPAFARAKAAESSQPDPDRAIAKSRRGALPELGKGHFESVFFGK